MVKADVRRDYYADLGLTPSAESEDIKKQFRKLGMAGSMGGGLRGPLLTSLSSQVSPGSEFRPRTGVHLQIPGDSGGQRNPQRPPTTVEI